MLVQAAIGGMGVAMGRTSMIAQELEQGTLVPLFDRWVAARARAFASPNCLALERRFPGRGVRGHNHDENRAER